MADVRKDICKCGKELSYQISSTMTPTQKVCECCGTVHYVQDPPIDWGKLKESMRTK